MDVPSIPQMIARVTKARDLGKAYRKIFSTPEGRLVLEDLLSVSGITRGVRSAGPDTAFQYEAVRLFMFGVLKKAGLRQQQLVEAVYARTIAAAEGSPDTVVPPSDIDAVSVQHSFAVSAPDNLL